MLTNALASMLPVERLSDWQMGWVESAATQLADAPLQVALRLERERRKLSPRQPRVGVLPAMAAAPEPIRQQCCAS